MWRAIGLMSGTSLDGVDAAWIETDGVRVARFGERVTLSYEDGLRRRLRTILDRAAALEPDDPELKAVEAELTERHAEAVLAVGTPADVIGMHGQTILHRPSERKTWQIGDARLLARRTGLPVVHDFRAADVAAGGEGAPLAPVFHAALAAGLARPLAVLNIGGVANVTWIGPQGQLVAFDTGPGNGPLDDWARRTTGRSRDENGALARAGRVAQAVLERLLADPYFARPAPKSLDRLSFSARLAESGLEALSPEDGAATLVAFTARAVAMAALPAPPLRWLVAGGGRRNPALMLALTRALDARVDPVEAVGWDGDALEAQCFGFLAARSLARLPLSFPGTTGVSHPLTGGRLARPDEPGEMRQNQDRG
ncbi:MAG TPA: anhydro-N-acetylmuramic acid kinase [Acetobacteraceae bacterium]|nr:anhydro-N-acetylmuramic acid kinase [Acetobacteraceae bacterium]